MGTPLFRIYGGAAPRPEDAAVAQFKAALGLLLIAGPYGSLVYFATRGMPNLHAGISKFTGFQQIRYGLKQLPQVSGFGKRPTRASNADVVGHPDTPVANRTFHTGLQLIYLVISKVAHGDDHDNDNNKENKACRTCSCLSEEHCQQTKRGTHRI